MFVVVSVRLDFLAAVVWFSMELLPADVVVKATAVRCGNVAYQAVVVYHVIVERSAVAEVQVEAMLTD